MKKFYLVLAAGLFSCSVFAQTSGSRANSGIRFGLKTGVNFATVSLSGKDVDDEETDGLKSLTSFQIGGFADIPVGGSLSIQPGLTLSGKGFKQEYSETDGGDSYEESTKTDVMYLEVPVNLVYRFGGLYLGAGPYAAFGLSGKSVYEEKSTEAGVTTTDEEDEKLKFGNDPEKHDLRRGDFGVNFLGGYQLSNGLNFGVNYGLGLSNLMPEVKDFDYKAKNRVFSITLGYSF